MKKLLVLFFGILSLTTLLACSSNKVNVTSANSQEKPIGLMAWETGFSEKNAETFAKGFADDIIIEATVLKKPVKGLNLASKVMWSASDTYESLEFTEHFSDGDYVCVQWEATAFGGKPLYGSTIIHTNSENKIDHVIIQHRPLDVMLEYSAEQNHRLNDEIGEGYFYNDNQ